MVSIQKVTDIRHYTNIAVFSIPPYPTSAVHFAHTSGISRPKMDMRQVGERL